MTYDPQIPLSTESPQTSASPVQVNFDQFAAIFSKLALGVFYNHMPFNSSSQGKHAAMILQNQTLDPGVTEDLGVLYSKNATSAASTEPQLFAQIPKFLPTQTDTTDAPNAPMQLTYNSVNTAGPVYYSFLPGGYIFYFGLVTATNLVPHTITLTPAPTQILVAIANPNTVETGSEHRPLKISTNITAANTFDVYASFSPLAQYDFSWMAVAIA